MIINESVGNTLALSQDEPVALTLGVPLTQGFYPQQTVEVWTQSIVPYYGTLVGADNYFKTRLNTETWDFADKADREASLHMATRVIEALHFKGVKANPDQILFFPRSVDVPGFVLTPTRCTVDRTITDFSECNNLGFPPICPDATPTGTAVVPGNIEVACYEIALCFLNGFDPEIESRNLSVNSQGYAGARTSYDRSFIQDHLRAGIPSAYAWSILRPYLADPQALRLVRGS